MMKSIISLENYELKQLSYTYNRWDLLIWRNHQKRYSDSQARKQQRLGQKKQIELSNIKENSHK